MVTRALACSLLAAKYRTSERQNHFNDPTHALTEQSDCKKRGCHATSRPLTEMLVPTSSHIN